MHQIKIVNTVEDLKEVVIANGEQYLNQDGSLATYVDENQIEQPLMNDSGSDVTIQINKTAQEKADEEQALKDVKAAEVQAKVDAYKAAQQAQIQNGGPGPVADFEIMKICNEHNCEFEVVFREE